tara:strand:- start:55 stop:294 length:240 start_codon:yes stop_codon:yes gene_type:complete
MKKSWATGNGRENYFDNTLKRMVQLNTPEVFLAYIVNQYIKMYHMTKNIVHYGDAIDELVENDIEKAREAVKLLLGESL